jgi:thiaminase/transcriptional activator TenA
MPAEPRYRRWVETYADPGFAELARWCAGLLDRAAAGLPETRLRQLESTFTTSLDHELAFWEV